MNPNFEYEYAKSPQVKLDVSSFIRVLFWASRPKTLLASISPVLIGASIAYHDLLVKSKHIDLGYFFATLSQIILCAVLIQILCNFVNDLYDFYKGADTAQRQGPVRVVSSGLISEKHMRLIILSLTACIITLGAILSCKGGLIILAIGICSIIGAFMYTAGPYPLAYHALGELFVIVFFGPVPVFGTYYLLANDYSLISVISGLTCGFISAALLLVNNIRDINEDASNNKTTLSVLLGRSLSIKLFDFFMIFPFLIVVILSYRYFSSQLLWCGILMLFAIHLSRRLRAATLGSELNKILALVGVFLFIFSISLSTLILV